MSEGAAGIEFSDDQFYSLAEAFLQRPGVELGKIFHNEGLKVNGKIFAMVTRGQLVVKVPAAQAAALIVGGEGTAFEPRPGRKMREWVMVATGDEPSRWRDLMEDAYAYGVALTR